MAVNINLERRDANGNWYAAGTAGFATGELLICYVAGLLHSFGDGKLGEWRIRVRH